MEFCCQPPRSMAPAGALAGVRTLGLIVLANVAAGGRFAGHLDDGSRAWFAVVRR
jgi:hypothetical protein